MNLGSSMTRILMALLMALVAWAAFAVANLGRPRHDAEIKASLTARFRIEQLQMLDEIESDLDRGCDDAARAFVRNGIDKDLRSLDVIVDAKENTGREALELMKAQYPAVLERVRTSRHVHSQAVPACTRAAPVMP